MKVKRECIERVREAADLHDVVSGYVQLKRSGGHWRGLSPFTVEKTPSFYVLPEKKFFKCFSTGYAGDVFRFLELKENFSFIEAVEWLAQRYGIALEYEEGSKETTLSKNTLLAIHEDALAHYQKNFAVEKTVQCYWIETRHFTLEAASRYGIGWAPERDHSLLPLLKQKKYPLEAIQQCGLFCVNERNQYDLKPRFSGRLMIPIYDVQGRVIGFSGRILPSVSAGKEVSKYVNSPETPIFHKGNILYGLHHARRFVKERFILVEGQLDTLRCWECGLDATVAPQGTGITETQMNLLRRYAEKLLCLTDGDAAGQKCALRVIELAFKTDIEVQIVTLASGDDPDSFLFREGKDGFDMLPQEAMIPYLIKTLLPQNVEATAVEKSVFLKKAYEMIAYCPSEVAKGTYLQELSTQLMLDLNAVRSDFRNFCGDRIFTSGAPSGAIKVTHVVNSNSMPSKLRSVEYDLLALILHDPVIGQKVGAVLDDAWISESFYGYLLLKVLMEIRKGCWEGPSCDNAVFDEKELNELFSILATEDTVDDVTSAVNTCLQALCEAFVKNKLNEINQKETQRRRFTKNSLDDLDFFKTLQSEKLRLRHMRSSCPKIS
ncbi:MAG: DNA primase [Opitutales bacterium]|nr:DNA primase [Opitutales bacterium]